MLFIISIDGAHFNAKDNECILFWVVWVARTAQRAQ